MSKPLQGRVALVTGSSRGIGRAVALRLATLGADVIVTYRRREEEAKKVAREIIGMGRRAHVLQADLSKLENAEALAEAALEFSGHVDILVNNAGVGYAQVFSESRPDLIVREVFTDLLSPILLTRALLPSMLERGWGRIINISSIAGITGAVYLAGYSSAKAGIIGFTRALAAEVAGKGVTVNAVAPGFVATRLGTSYFEWLEKVVGVKGAYERYLSSIPPGRLVTEEEVASVVAYLSLPESSGVNGQVIVVDAGATLSPGMVKAGLG